MDPDTLKNSWALVAKSGDEVPLFFYSHLFLSHPELREMFPVSMAAQRDKLVAALGAVVSNSDQLDQVTPVLAQLGRDHRRFAVVAEHYSAVGASLLPQRPRRWRYFSPANAPRPDGSIELHIQLEPGGQVSSAAVRSLREGDTIRVGAPVGEALALPADGRDLLMVAGGTGLAPLRAMLEQLDHGWGGTTPNVHLFHGARMPWNLYEHTQLTRLTRRPWFSYTPAVSDDGSYPGQRGLVGTVAAAYGTWTDRIALVCGSPAMVAHTVGELTAAGLPAANIRTEQFVGGHQ